MIDKDGIERPDNPHAHMVENLIAPSDREIDENYNFVNKNIFFRFWGRFFRRIVIMFMGPWLKKRYKLQIYGKENIKLVKRKGVIVTVNHVHNFDNLLIGTKLLHHRKCYFITLKENVNMPFIGFLLRSLGGIPIPDSTKAIPYFDNCITELMKKKKAVIICPEASLWPYYRDIRPFKKGAFRFAVKNNVPVLPVVISFRRKLKKHSAKKGKEKYRYYFTVIVGKPTYQNPELEARKQVIDLTERVHEFYKNTMDSFYTEEEKLEQQELEMLVKGNKKIAKHFEEKLKNQQSIQDELLADDEKLEDVL